METLWFVFRFLAGSKEFSLLQSLTTFSGAHLAPCWEEVLIPGIKRQECAVDYLPPYSAKFKNVWSNTSIHSYIFNFTFISHLFYVCNLFCLYFFYIIIVSLWNRVRIITATVRMEVLSMLRHTHVTPVRSHRIPSTPHSRQRELDSGLYITPH
jgi:hypothetical protein